MLVFPEPGCRLSPADEAKRGNWPDVCCPDSRHEQPCVNLEHFIHPVQDHGLMFRWNGIPVLGRFPENGIIGTSDAVDSGEGRLGDGAAEQIRGSLSVSPSTFVSSGM
jgi:hypothetical protein